MDVRYYPNICIAGVDLAYSVEDEINVLNNEDIAGVDLAAVLFSHLGCRMCASLPLIPKVEDGETYDLFNVST
ncbi:hypothetical protein SAY87_027650 [Trapa incisa]|uniref:Uncharacterized protein n=1 Tax=Trapa incisa TaxID=236973 RepID=A0AAN7JMS2_9MYRT|nr:hypothetical protein SAY87_027650 [Trapa incisa]